MSASAASLRGQIAGASDLQAVVRTMKTVAASSIGQYEASVRALAEYLRTVELGLGVCLRHREHAKQVGASIDGTRAKRSVVIVFGSDQGLVGRFNDIIVDYATTRLATLSRPAQIWAVGGRVHARLVDAGLAPEGVFPVPASVESITPLVSQILVKATPSEHADVAELLLAYNRPLSGSTYEPVVERILPLDDAWRRRLVERAWPSRCLPQIMGTDKATLSALVREYLFISLFAACARSLASENASRLAAMERADQNIDDLLKGLTARLHRQRQSSIDEELFDVMAGFEALSPTKARPFSR